MLIFLKLKIKFLKQLFIIILILKNKFKLNSFKNSNYLIIYD